MRSWISLVAALVFISPACAGGDGLAGNWKVTIYEEGQYLNFWLLKLEAKDGKLAGSTEPLTRGVPEATVKDVKVDGDLLNLTLALPNRITFNFDGKLPRAGGKKIYGSITREGHSTPAFFEATTAKNSFEANIDVLTRTPSDPRVFGTLLSLISQAKGHKIAAREVKEWTDGVLKTAESYGPVWQTEFGVKLITALEPDFPELAIEAGSNLEKALDPKAPVDTQLRLLTALAGAYRSAGKKDELAKIDARVGTLEGAAHEENIKKELSFKIEPYTGKVNEPVLVELFTGAQCPPCVAADIGFDALGKAFKDTEAILLQYHLHVPDSDALTNPSTEARAEFYSKTLRGTPAIYFNGEAKAAGGGGRADGAAKYKEYREVVESLIEKKPGGKIVLAASRKGDAITIQSSAVLADDVKGKVKLRFALTEDWARYKARNGLMFHHHVVRDMPGGADGFAVAKTVEKNLTVDLGELRTKLSRYLDKHQETEPFPDSQRPMRLSELHVAAFLQNDDTGEVLQAICVPVRSE